MSDRASRRTFLTTGLALPATALTTSAKPSAPKLEHRKLGKTGLKVTTVGFGCMVTSDASVIARAVDMGVNFFDTARVYQSGNNERMVGAALKGKRQGIILCSKSLGRTKERALADLDTSLKELQTDYLDVWYLHSKKAPADITDELLEAQAIAQEGRQNPLRRHQYPRGASRTDSGRDPVRQVRRAAGELQLHHGRHH